MDLVEAFVDFALLGATWVLYLLIGLSVLSIGVMIERALWLRDRGLDTGGFVRELRAAWRGGDLDAFAARHRESPAVAAQVALAGIAEREHGPEAVSEAMQGARARWRKDGERNLIVLGTLGNNVPFVGLFGTVLGIIAALQMLDPGAQSRGAADAAVTAELAEALVATAVGLMVALPAVVAYNYFNRRLKAVITAADECAHAVLGLVHGDAHARRAGAR
jgi:biopolymer transport protein ExbB/TolQ